MGLFNQGTILGKKSEVIFSLHTNVNFSTHKSDKEQIINLIILDKSGSMTSLRKAAIDGFNETIAGIRKAQEKYAETQEHYVTLLSFCSCEMNFLYENTPIEEVKDIAEADYKPCCGTPLYDAMGLGINRLKNKIEGLKNCSVIATIITDGYENSSKEYTGSVIGSLVKTLTEQGWIFNYMGTNQDVTAVADDLNIRNRRHYENNYNGFRNEMSLGGLASSLFYGQMHYSYSCDIDNQAARDSIKKEYANDLFKNQDDKKEGDKEG